MNIRLITTFFMVLMITNSFAYSPLEQVSCYLFGDEDVAKEYQQIIKTALTDFNIGHAIPIKKIKDDAPSFVQQFSSFTWFGIWINEQEFIKRDREEQIFTAYHEAAHYWARHAQHMIGFNALLGLLGFATLYQLSNQIIPSKTIGVCASVLLSSGILYKTIPNCSRLYELDANELATYKLLETNQKYVIDYMLNKLRTEPCNGSAWFPSSNKNILIIENAINVWNQKLGAGNEI